MTIFSTLPDPGHAATGDYQHFNAGLSEIEKFDRI